MIERFTQEEYTQAVTFLQETFGKHQPCDIKKEDAAPRAPQGVGHSCRSRRSSEHNFGTCCEDCEHLTPKGCGTTNLMCLTFVCPAVENILDAISPDIMKNVASIRDRICEICYDEKISPRNLYFKSEAEVLAVLMH